jgi:effector-binding domain-containing protein
MAAKKGVPLKRKRRPTIPASEYERLRSMMSRMTLPELQRETGYAYSTLAAFAARNFPAAEMPPAQHDERPKREPSTPYKGVYPSKGRFKAQIVLPGRKIMHVGQYGTAEEAHQAYRTTAQQLKDAK